MFSEPFAVAWNARYGTEFPGEAGDFGRFLNHRSARDFRAEPIPESVMSAIVAAGQSAASSSNVQAYSIVSVQDPVLRAEINKVAHDQAQITNASWFFAVLADLHRAHQFGQAHGVATEAIDSMELGLVACIDAALFAERMVSAAEAVGIGTCYIGAVRNDVGRVAQLLNLPAHCLPLFGLCFGYPATLDPIKPRLSQAAVWYRETYEPNEEWRDLDTRMAPLYAHTKNPESTWSMRIARRCQESYLEGRLALKDFAHGQGLFRR
jgi:nitroreductase